MADKIYPFPFDVDEALKAHLKGMTVYDDAKSPRKVQVLFVQPDLQKSDQNYPYITIALIDIVPDEARNVRGHGTLPYIPYGMADPGIGFTYETDTPIPVVLDYQVTAFSRHPYHSGHLNAEMIRRIPFKYGNLYVPSDNTERRMTLRPLNTRAFSEGDRRLYMSSYTVRVEAEILISDIRRLTEVQSVNFTITESFYPDPLITA
jgi:hypothetical protein